jgi:hypothetical protein
MKLTALLTLATLGLGAAAAAPTFAHAQWRGDDRADSRVVAFETNRNVARYDRNHDGRVMPYEVRLQERRERFIRARIAHDRAVAAHMARARIEARVARSEAWRAGWP